MNGELHPRILDTRTGELFYIDPTAARVGHLRRRVHAFCAALAPYIRSTPGTRLIMETLTYAKVGDYRHGHIRKYMKRLRRELGSALLAYAWVAELQQRGAVHYHVLLLVRKGVFVPYPDLYMWPWGHSNVTMAKSPFYVMKYVSKAAFSNGDGWVNFPKGLRIFAVWISPDLIDDLARFNFKLSALPQWLADTLSDIGVIVKAKRAKGGGWYIVGDTGPPEKLTSPFRVISLYD